jgi:hypothetical protein
MVLDCLKPGHHGYTGRRLRRSQVARLGLVMAAWVVCQAASFLLGKRRVRGSSRKQATQSRSVRKEGQMIANQAATAMSQTVSRIGEEMLARCLVCPSADERR